MIEVIKPGIYSTVQDKGRLGHAHLGIPPSGAIDGISFRLANAILGNNDNDAVLEITFGGAEFKFLIPTAISLTGGDYTASINGKKIPMNQLILVEENDVLQFGQRRSGVRTYLGVLGGINTKQVLGSRSYYPSITADFRIKKGDFIETGTPLNDALTISSESTSFLENPMCQHNLTTECTVELQVYVGPEYSRLSYSGMKTLNLEMTIGRNNRMGYMLQETVANQITPIHTSSALPGTVQLTPFGQLIILMNDGQVTVGYPRIFQLTDYSKDLLSQCAQGQKIKFALINQ
ncbi:MAG: biotin-dependent carboxyltransferase family protein [Flavobacteriaceae bacterium]